MSLWLALLLPAWKLKRTPTDFIGIPPVTQSRRYDKTPLPYSSSTSVTGEPPTITGNCTEGLRSSRNEMGMGPLHAVPQQSMEISTANVFTRAVWFPFILCPDNEK